MSRFHKRVGKSTTLLENIEKQSRKGEIDQVQDIILFEVALLIYNHALHTQLFNSMGYNVKGQTPIAIRAIVSFADAWQMLNNIYMVIVIAGDKSKAPGIILSSKTCISSVAIAVRLYD
jgi:hypothetical protein